MGIQNILIQYRDSSKIFLLNCIVQVKKYIKSLFRYYGQYITYTPHYLFNVLSINNPSYVDFFKDFLNLSQQNTLWRES